MLSSPSLASGLRRGDPVAWERFNRLWGKTLLDYCQHRGIRLQDAEEISQNVLAKIYRGIERFERDGEKYRLRYWVFDIARKEVIRFRERYLSKPHSLGGSDFLRFAEQAPNPESEEESTEVATFESVLMCNILTRIESDFEPRVWKAFWLFVVDGHTGPEIAAELGMTANGVRQAVHRVKKRIRAERESFPPTNPDCA
jgi:RNA polymerase sigma factor (sigma-70 family)